MINNKLLIASLLANIALIIWIAMFYWNDDTTSLQQELYKSQGREEELLKKYKGLQFEHIEIIKKRDSLQVLIKQKPKDRIVIIKERDERIDAIDNHGIITSLDNLSRRFNEAGISASDNN